jgi:predicted lipoprotein with Yx(FWY)xxD motif
MTLFIPTGPAARRLTLVGGLATVALIAAACGDTTAGSGSSAGAAASSTGGTAYGGYAAPAPAPGGAAGSGTSAPAMVSTGPATLGTIVTDQAGRTLYLFEKDTGPTSTCTGACAQAWPPLLTGTAPGAGPGATSSLIGSSRRSDGTVQVTYAGHPLYTFSGDRAAGQTNGEGLKAFGAGWYALTPQGMEIGHG